MQKWSLLLLLGLLFVLPGLSYADSFSMCLNSTTLQRNSTISTYDGVVTTTIATTSETIQCRFGCDTTSRTCADSDTSLMGVGLAFGLFVCAFALFFLAVNYFGGESAEGYVPKIFCFIIGEAFVTAGFSDLTYIAKVNGLLTLKNTFEVVTGVLLITLSLSVIYFVVMWFKDEPIREAERLARQGGG